MVEQEAAIVDAFKTTGDADYLLKVAVADLAALSALIVSSSLAIKAWPT